jgi:hypothetical protein
MPNRYDKNGMIVVYEQKDMLKDLVDALELMHWKPSTVQITRVDITLGTEIQSIVIILNNFCSL